MHALGPYLVSTSDVHRKYQIPVLVLHVLKADIAQNAGIVDEDIYPSEVLDSGVYD